MHKNQQAEGLSTSERMLLENTELRMRVAKLSKLIEVGQVWQSERDLDRLLDLVGAKIRDALSAERYSIFQVHPERNEVTSRIASDVGGQVIRQPIGVGLVGYVAQHGVLLNIADAYTDPRFDRSVDERTGYRTRSILCAPLQARADDGGIETIGVVQVINKLDGIFNEEDELLLVALAAQAAAAIENAKHMTELRTRTDQLTRIVEVGKAWQSERDLDRLLDLVGAKICDALGAERYSIFLVNSEKGEVTAKIASGMAGQIIRLKLGVGLVGYVAQHGELINLPDAYADPRFDRSTDARTGYRTRSILCAPMVARADDGGIGEIVGVIEVINKLEGSFNEEDENTLIALASQAAAAVESAKRVNEQKKSLESFIETMATTLDARNADTGEHSRRVAEMSRKLARALNLPPQQVENIHYAALLHDCGKIGVPEAILLKQERYTPEDVHIMNNHVEWSYRILQNIRWGSHQRDIPSIALGHHERWDGKGYPHKLCAHEIPLGARIIAVCDVFDALTSARPYKTGMAVSEVLPLMWRDRGRAFDPDVLRAFLHLQAAAGEQLAADLLASEASEPIAS